MGVPSQNVQRVSGNQILPLIPLTVSTGWWVACPINKNPWSACHIHSARKLGVNPHQCVGHYHIQPQSRGFLSDGLSPSIITSPSPPFMESSSIFLGFGNAVAAMWQEMLVLHEVSCRKCGKYFYILCKMCSAGCQIIPPNPFGLACFPFGAL